VQTAGGDAGGACVSRGVLAPRERAVWRVRSSGLVLLRAAPRCAAREASCGVSRTTVRFGVGMCGSRAKRGCDGNIVMRCRNSGFKKTAVNGPEGRQCVLSPTDLRCRLGTLAVSLVRIHSGLDLKIQNINLSEMVSYLYNPGWQK
jgi:hypothetical protein